jgi:phospholipase/carboxylesterase
MRDAASSRSDDPGRLRARPPAESAGRVAPGTSTVAHGALLHVPPAAAQDVPCPLVVLFHGAGSTAAAGLALLSGEADRAGLVLLAPQARSATWDVVRAGFGPDVARLDDALVEAFASCPVDPSRIALGGFSDGASYALSLGIGNGDLAKHLIAFSPGFAAPAAQRGRPRILITHGTGDAVLPIDRTSRHIVPQLRGAGYDVDYEEFDGGHVVTPALARRASDWLTAG